MPSYIAESYLPRTRRGELSALTAQARDAARALAGEGHQIAYLRCAFVPEDEVFLLWFVASSPAIVTEAGHRAGLEFDRVIEELEPSSQEQPRPQESSELGGVRNGRNHEMADDAAPPATDTGAANAAPPSRLGPSG
jgi:hypothetical protein